MGTAPFVSTAWLADLLEHPAARISEVCDMHSPDIYQESQIIGVPLEKQRSPEQRSEPPWRI